MCRWDNENSVFSVQRPPSHSKDTLPWFWVWTCRRERWSLMKYYVSTDLVHNKNIFEVPTLSNRIIWPHVVFELVCEACWLNEVKTWQKNFTLSCGGISEGNNFGRLSCWKKLRSVWKKEHFYSERIGNIWQRRSTFLLCKKKLKPFQRSVFSGNNLLGMYVVVCCERSGFQLFLKRLFRGEFKIKTRVIPLGQ